MVNRDKLIMEVKKHTNLYDTRDERHRDIEFRDQCWIQIARKLDNDCEALKREWKILRDSYRQVIKRKTHAKACRNKWRYESAMEFLLPFMTERSGGSRVAVEVVKPMEESDAENGCEQLKPLEAVDVDTPTCWPADNNQQQEVDALELFFSSVCQSTKRLPKLLQNRVKRDVLDALLRAEEEQHVDDDCKNNIFGNL